MKENAQDFLTNTLVVFSNTNLPYSQNLSFFGIIYSGQKQLPWSGMRDQKAEI